MVGELASTQHRSLTKQTLFPNIIVSEHFSNVLNFLTITFHPIMPQTGSDFLGFRAHRTEELILP